MDDSNYLYWENRRVTDDEVDIVNFLNSNDSNLNPNVLHIGIGNSFLPSNLNCYKKITGITISQNEIKHAQFMTIKNYNYFFLNKYKKNSLNIFKNKRFDIIIDTNMKSFSCCDKAFENLFDHYTKLLENNGYIITHINGLKWSRIIKPKLTFSLKKFFHKRLKEYDGPINNILNIHDCKKLANKNNLKLDLNYKNLIIFKNEK